MLILTGSNAGQIDDPEKPVIAASADIGEAHIIPSHVHSRGQLLYATKGKLRVTIENTKWLVTNRYAAWIPPGLPHYVSGLEAVTYRSVFIDAEASKCLPTTASLLEVNPLTRELILETTKFSDNYDQDSAESRLTTVLLDQLSKLPNTRLSIPIPNDSRLDLITNILIDNPDDDRTLLEWSKNIGYSTRTLSRIFHKETGYSFTEWKQRLRLSYAQDRLLEGDAVTTIALNLGYRSTSAFSAMFKRETGISPVQYISNYNKSS